MLNLFFIYGLIIGSFLNVCIYRIPAGMSVISPPSSCGNCGHRLSYVDMLPVLNYILYKGKCRYCKSPYSMQYPIIELSNGILYVLIGIKYVWSLYSVILCILVSLLIVSSVIDLRHMIIPGSIIISGIILGLFLLINERTTLIDKLLGLLLGFGLFIIIALVTGVMGGGDIKLIAVIGLMFGTKGAIFISLFSFFIGAVVSVALICLKVKNRKDKIPFGPFISLAALLYIFYGKEIIAAYLNLF